MRMLEHALAPLFSGINEAKLWQLTVDEIKLKFYCARNGGINSRTPVLSDG